MLVSVLCGRGGLGIAYWVMPYLCAHMCSIDLVVGWGGVGWILILKLVFFEYACLCGSMGYLVGEEVQECLSENQKTVGSYGRRFGT